MNDQRVMLALAISRRLERKRDAACDELVNDKDFMMRVKHGVPTARGDGD
jgi:hypothetical protein